MRRDPVQAPGAPGDPDSSGESDHDSGDGDELNVADAAAKELAAKNKLILQQEREAEALYQRKLEEERKFRNPKLKLKAIEDYDFQRENTSREMSKFSLVDSVFFLLSRSYEIHHVFSDIDVFDILSKSKSGDFLLRLIPQVEGQPTESLYPKSINSIVNMLTSHRQSDMLKEFLGALTQSFRASYLEGLLPAMKQERPVTMGELALELLEEIQKVKVAARKDTLSILLLKLITVDVIGNQHPNADPIAALLAVKDRIAISYSTKQFNSAFAHHLVRAVVGDLSESTTVDSVAEKVVEKFKELLWSVTKHSSAQDYAEKIGETEYFPETNTRFTRYDLTHMLGIGLLEVGFQPITNTARRTLIYRLPDGSMYWIDNQPILCNVQIANSKEQDIDYFPYPKVKDNVRKLEQKEQFALSDFDWVMVVYNLEGKHYQWYSSQQSLTMDYSSCSRKWLHFGFSERITSFNKCIKILIRASTLQQDGYCLPDEDKYYDFFISDDKNATVGDLIAFLAPRLERNSIFLKQGIALSDITFVDTQSIIKQVGTQGKRSVYKQYHNTKVPKDAKERIIDILEKDLKLKTTEEDQQIMHYECLIHSRKIRTALIEKSNYSEANKTKAEAIKLKAAGNSEMIKPSTSRFVNFMYQLNLADKHYDIGTQTFFANRNLVFWLPMYLLLDVSQVGSTLMNPKTDLLLKCISNHLLERNGLFLNHRYSLIGLICRREHTDNEFYPVEVDGLSGRSVGYLNRAHGVPTDRIDDGLVKYALFERCEYEVDDPANEYIQE